MLGSQIRQHGNSLVELMISMTLGLASISAMASLVGHGIALNSSLLAKSRLDEEINAVVAVLRHDLKRAGYYSRTDELVKNPSALVNPFEGSITTAAYTSEAANSCINFAYDRNKNGVLDTSGTNENFGYRLKDKAVEIRLDGASCDETGWHDLTDPKVVQVMALEFTIEQTTVQQITRTRVNIALQARLKRHPDILRSVNSRILIENYE